MNLRELRDFLDTLTDEQLDQPVNLYDETEKQFVGIARSKMVGHSDEDEIWLEFGCQVTDVFFILNK